MHYVILAIIMFFIIFFSWKWWGKSLANYFVNEPAEKEHRRSVERKIEFLKKSAEDLKQSDDEVRVTKMLEVIQKQLKAKEEELKKLDKKLGL